MKESSMVNKDFALPLDTCPLCDQSGSKLPNYNDYRCKCPRCGMFFVEGMLVNRIHAMHDGSALSGYTREHWEVFGQPACLEISNFESILAQCPETIKEKTEKLLLALNRSTKQFGQEIKLNLTDDYPLAYAKNDGELYAFLQYLTEQSYITSLVTSASYEVVVTGKGIEAVESRLLSPTITVFISSTCYDLIDLRAELADFLDSKGFITRASDNPYRFDVDPTEDSIRSCLRNVETADVVVCIVDGRYGPPLPPDNKFSATHHEVKRAREIGKPVYIFMRDKALADYDLLRRDSSLPTRWVESNNEDHRKKWLDFIEELKSLPAAQVAGHSNWVDPFQTSVQLKKLVLKRLGEHQRRLIAKP